MSPWLSAPLFTAASPLGTEAVGSVSARADTASAATPATTSATATGHRRHLEVSSCARMGRPPALSVACGRAAEDNKGAADSEGVSSWSPALREWAVPVSNQRPPACKAGALPAELTARARNPRAARAARLGPLGWQAARPVLYVAA